MTDDDERCVYAIALRWRSVREPHDERQGDIEASDLLAIEATDELSNPFTPNGDRLVGHDLGLNAQASRLASTRADSDQPVSYPQASK